MSTNDRSNEYARELLQRKADIRTNEDFRQWLRQQAQLGETNINVVYRAFGPKWEDFEAVWNFLLHSGWSF